MIERPDYINELIKFKDKELIKIITGIRRCGKSTLMELFKNYLIKELLIVVLLKFIVYARCS